MFKKQHLAAASCAATLLLAGCANLPFIGHKNIVAKSDTCGTTSQYSEVHYFANKAELADWVEFRQARGIKPKLADKYNGVIIVELGQRMTDGYKMQLMTDKTQVADNVLELHINTSAPPEYAAVDQAMSSSCIVLNPPAGNYQQIKVIDQLGNQRAQTKL